MRRVKLPITLGRRPSSPFMHLSPFDDIGELIAIQPWSRPLDRFDKDRRYHLLYRISP